MACVLLLGAGTQSLAILPSLYRLGHKILMHTGCHSNYGDRSRYVSKVFRYEVTDMAAYADYVRKIVAEEGVDVVLPMGDEAALEIRKFANTPLIMMTANLSDELRNEYLQKGFMDFLPKPIEILALQKIIEQHMPHAYRYDPSFEEGAGGFLDSRSRGKANRRTLETFIYEVEPLAEKLSHYAKDDLELFRIKVHGIKGASRQIGKVSLSERAEIMEMAAKTQNISFIEEHMADLQKELEEAISQAREDIANIPTVYESSQAGETDKEELFARLKTGFDNYELGEIEECIAALEHASLTTEELELLEQAKNACNEMDYEAGSALFL